MANLVDSAMMQFATAATKLPSTSLLYVFVVLVVHAKQTANNLWLGSNSGTRMTLFAPGKNLQRMASVCVPSAP